MEIDPFESEAFKKAASGLVSAALRLVGSEEALVSVLEVVSLLRLVHALSNQQF